MIEIEVKDEVASEEEEQSEQENMTFESEIESEFDETSITISDKLTFSSHRNKDSSKHVTEIKIVHLLALLAVILVGVMASVLIMEYVRCRRRSKQIANRVSDTNEPTEVAALDGDVTDESEMPGGNPPFKPLTKINPYMDHIYIKQINL